MAGDGVAQGDVALEAVAGLRRRLGRLPLDVKLVVGLCAVGVALRLWPIAGVSTEYDEGVYWQSLRALADGHTLFREVFSSQPPFFLLCLAPFYLLLGQTLVAARLGVALYSLVGLVAAYSIGRRIGGRGIGVIACALLAVDPLYLRASDTLQAEAPSLVFGLVSVACAAWVGRSVGGRRVGLALVCGVALSLGALTKLFEVVTLAPVLVYLLEPVWRGCVEADGRPRLPERGALLAGLRGAAGDVAWCAGGAALAGVVVLAPFVGEWGALYDQVARFHLAAAQGVNGGLRHNVAVLTQARGEYPLALATVGLLVVALWRGGAERWRALWRLVAPLLWWAGSLLALVRQQPLFEHHVVVVAVPLALLAAAACAGVVGERAVGERVTERVAEQAQGRRGAQRALGWLLAGALLSGLVVGVGHAQGAAAQNLSARQRTMVLALETETLLGDVVVSDDQYLVGLAGHSTPPELVDTSQVRIASGYLTAGQVETLIVRLDTRVVMFASGRFDALPGFRAWVTGHFSKIADFGGGDALYLRQPQPPAVA